MPTPSTGTGPGWNGPVAPVNGPLPMTDTALAGLKQYQTAVDTAKANKDAAAQQVAQLSAQLAQTPPQVGGVQTAEGGNFGQTSNPAYTQISQQLERAMSLYDSAAREHQKALGDLADASTKAAQSSDPTTRATLQATADKAQIEAQKATSDYQEWQAAAPERKAAVAAQQLATGLQADQAALTLQQQTANAPAQQQLLQQQIQANSTAIQQAQTNLSVLQQTSGNQVTQSNQAVSAGDLALQQSQAGLEATQRANRQAPTDTEVATARQQTLDQGAATLAGTQANTNATNVNTAQTQFGGLADLEAYKDKLKQSYLNGDLSMDDVTRMLSARVSGTNVYDASKSVADIQQAQLNSQISQRGQDASLAGTKAGVFGSMANTGMTTLAGMNTYATPGSDLGGKAVGAWMNMAQNRLAQAPFNAPAPIQPQPLPPMLQPFAAQQGGGGATPQAGAGHVTINIGSPAPVGPPTAAPPPQNAPPMPALQGNASGSGGNGVGVSSEPFQAQGASAMPQFVQNEMAASPQDVIAKYPDAARRAGML